LIHELFFSLPQNAEINVLDVGPQTFSGTSLLSRLHSKESFNNLKMKVSAVDIHDKFFNLKEFIAPEIEFIKSDIFQITDRTWNLIVLSHVIEHVPSPEIFIKKLKSLATKFVIVACPWSESPLLTNGHINSISKKFVRSVGGTHLKIYTNYCWGKTREVCIFVVPGTG
jgi:ubiquinone/menaquinone biosynthesis C-methylase UbiE